MITEAWGINSFYKAPKRLLRLDSLSVSVERPGKRVVNLWHGRWIRHEPLRAGRHLHGPDAVLLPWILRKVPSEVVEDDDGSGEPLRIVRVQRSGVVFDDLVAPSLPLRITGGIRLLSRGSH